MLHEGPTALAFDASGEPGIAYIGETPGELRYPRHDAAGWHVEVVAAFADWGKHPDLAFDPQGRPAIGYVACDWSNSCELWLARRQGAAWTRERLATGPLGQWASVAIDPAGNPGIVYPVILPGSWPIRFAHWDGNAWQREDLPLATPGDTANFAALVFAGNGDAIATYRQTRDGAVVARRATSWDVHPLGGVSGSIALDPVGNPVVSYRIANGFAGLARWDGSDWQSEAILPADGVSDLAFASGGEVAVSLASQRSCGAARRSPSASATGSSTAASCRRSCRAGRRRRCRSPPATTRRRHRFRRRRHSPELGRFRAARGTAAAVPGPRRLRAGHRQLAAAGEGRRRRRGPGFLNRSA